MTSRGARSRGCSNAGDFSRSSIGARIRAGYEDEKAHGVSDARELRFGVIAADVEQVGATG